jgi:hypothetical protein
MLVPISSRAVEIYDRFPDTVHASERYVIYSHGMIVEGDDPKPISHSMDNMIFLRSHRSCLAQADSISLLFSARRVLMTLMQIR